LWAQIVSAIDAIQCFAGDSAVDHDDFAFAQIDRMACGLVSNTAARSEYEASSWP